VTRTFAAVIALASAMGTATAAVNVNTAQQSELQSTRGLDKFKAKQIIEYRHQHGPFKSLEDLTKAIGVDSTAKAASQVAFEGDPYVPPAKTEKKQKK